MRESRAASVILAVNLLLLTGPAAAQSSASYSLEGPVLNAGGHPEAGAVLTSASFRISIDSLGEGVLGSGLSSASFSMDAGRLPAYQPPGEVLNLVLLADHQTLQWDAERSAGVYNLYRAALSALSGANGGSCEQQELAGTSTTDTGTPATGDGWFYLVTVKNRLGEEGTRGIRSSGAERPETSPCP